nr:MAG TPA_asm: chromosome segregation ATPase [Caudoviricetes sp.]
MATLSTFQKFKEEQEKKKQGGQQSTQQSTQQSGQKNTGLMNSYQQFMAKQQGQETAYTPESDYGQRVMDVIGKAGNTAASRNGEWTADASGGNAAEINALLREYDAYTGDKSGMTEYRNALLDYNKRIQAENQYYAGFGTKDDFNRVRSGYTNFGVGYDPRSYGLDDASARKLRQESAQNDAKEAQRALAELNSARKNFAAVDSEWRAMDERYRSFTIDEYDKDLTQRWQAAKDQVTAAENALLNARNRMDAYNATWGKVDKYGEASEAAKGTDTSYTGPGYESIADWENKKNEEQAAQDAQAQRPDYVPGTLQYTSDTEPTAEDRLGLWRSLTPEQKQDAVNSSNVQLNNVVMAGNDGYWDLLTDNEVETYYYIKGQQGQEAANQYLDDMYIELSRRNELKTVQSIENANGWEKAGLTAVSVGANLVGAIPAALGKTADMVAGRTNPYSSMQFFQRYASYIRGSVGQDIGDWTESKLADKFGEQFAAKAGNLANQTFQALMSGVDSFVGAKTFGQGMALPAGPFDFHVGGYTTVMGLGAFAQRAQEMELKGATPTQIAIGSIGSGILEALFEDVSMEVFFTNILDNPAKTAGEFVKKLAIQMGVEGSEEMFTEMGNIILDAINMGKNSENSMAVREYMAQGMTEEKARQQVRKDNAVDILWAGYGGAFSAGAMAAGGQLATDTVRKAGNTIGNYSVGDTLTKNGRYVDLQEQANALQDQKKSAKLSKAAQEVAQKASAGDKSIGNKYRMGKVASQIARQAGREASKAEATEFRNAAEKYLSERRDIQDKKRALNVLTRAYDGTTIPGDNAAMRRWGNQMTREILEGIGGKQTLQENAKARASSAIKTAVDVQSSVLGFEPTRGETAFDYNQEGDTQAYLKDSSDPVNIRAENPVAKIENGKMWLNTDEGQTVEADNVSFGTAEDASLASIVSRMNITADQANSLYAARTESGMSAKSYATALQNAYLKGFSGVTYNGIQDYSAAAKLPGDVRRTAWEAGRQMRNRQTTEQAAKISKGTQMVNQRGLTFRDSAKSIKNLNEQQKTGIAAAKALAAAGLHIEVYASTEAERASGAPNGFYRSSDGTIHIDLNAGDNGQGTVAYAVAHEATHFIKDFSATKYQTYADILIEAAESKGISYDSLLDRQLAKLSALEENRGKTAEELQQLAYDETIAEMSETMLTDTDAAQRVSQELYKKDRTLWEKIRDFFTGLVEKLRNAYKGLDPDSDMGRITRQAIRDNEKVAQAWAEALVEAGSHYSTGRDGFYEELQDAAALVEESSPMQAEEAQRNTQQAEEAETVQEETSVEAAREETVSETAQEQAEEEVEEPEEIREEAGEQAPEQKPEAQAAENTADMVRYAREIMESVEKAAAGAETSVDSEQMDSLNQMRTELAIAASDVILNEGNTEKVQAAYENANEAFTEILDNVSEMVLERAAQPDAQADYRDVGLGEKYAALLAESEARAARVKAEFEKQAAQLEEQYKEQAARWKTEAEARDAQLEARAAQRKAESDARAAQLEEEYAAIRAESDARAAQLEEEYADRRAESEDRMAQLKAYYEERDAKMKAEAEEGSAALQSAGEEIARWENANGRSEYKPIDLDRANWLTEWFNNLRYYDSEGNDIVGDAGKNPITDRDGAPQVFYLDTAKDYSSQKTLNRENTTELLKTEDAVHALIRCMGHQFQFREDMENPDGATVRKAYLSPERRKLTMTVEDMANMLKKTYGETIDRMQRDFEAGDLSRFPEIGRNVLKEFLKGNMYKYDVIIMKDTDTGVETYIVADRGPVHPVRNGSQDGQKNNARGGERFSTRQNKRTVAEMQTVASVPGYEGSLKASDVIKTVAEFFDSIGNTAENEELGSIVLQRRGVKNDIAHGIGREKAAAFMAVPDVLKHGKVVDYQVNWKGRGYDTAIIAAPIQISGEDYFAGVCVKSASGENKFYVHEVLSIKEGATPFNRAALETSVDSGGDTPSINNILSELIDVKENLKYSSRNVRDAEYMELAKDPAKNQTALQQMVKQAAKDAGYTQLFYHGSKKGGGFTVFRDWQYFTENRDYAKRYTDRNNEKSLYTTYVKMENPFDTRIDSVRDIFEDARMEYGMGELLENGLPDWTDGYDIADYIDENDLPYDSIVLDEGGDMVNGKPVRRGLSYVVRKSNQVKSADVVTYDDNGNVIPLSQRFDTANEDIRYSSRNTQESQVERLARKNEELKAEAEYLKQVVQIQKQGNRKNLRDRESVNAIAKGILESVNAKDTEFGKKLNDFYRDLVTVEMDYDTMQEKAGELADRALEHHQAERDSYAQEVLDFLKKRRVSLTESQIGDAEYTYGSLSEFKKAIKGSIIIDQNSTTSLDQLWQEAAAQFPDQFSADITEADMPDGIANIVSWATNAEADSETEFQYYKAETRADLTRKILMGFLDAKPIESVSDTLKQQLADLKQQHKQEMRELRRSWDEEAKAMERSHRYDLEAERKRGKAAVEALKYQQEVIQKAQEGLWETERADIKRSYEKQMKELKEQNTQKAHEKVESRHRTEERHKLQNTIDTLNRMLLRPTNTSHVPQELQSSVAMAMKVINGVILDSKTGQNADRLAKYAEQLRKLEGNPVDNAEKIADLNRKIGDLTGRDISMKAALTSLQEQYAKLEGQDGGLYDSNIEALIEDAKETIGNTAYKDLSLKQLKAVRDTYTALLTTIRNANKAFVAGQNARIDDMVKRATIELSMKGKKKPTQTAIGKKVDQFFWNNEKPVYAFERIGSAVMSELYRNLRNGEDTFYRDVNSAREFFLGAAEKNGFDKWNLDELQEFEASNGQKFQLSLDERMSLYAYSLRPQARDHLTKGGIVLAENTKRLQRGPLGVTMEVTYDDANAYTLTNETIDAIVGSLTKEQRQFAYEMQQYLAKVMGAKGDEVNMALYGIKKFGEETYWPLKSSGVFSERIREQQERTGNKVKNNGFTKALTQHANNAIELSSLTETWAEHVNDMSMYHAFTLPMEDFYRVYNWTQKGDTDGKRTMGVRQMIQQTAGKGAVTYIDQFLKDLNGGLRADPRETVSKAMLSGFKKAAVSASLSVAIQQPSAVGRALAYIEANYFVGSKVEGAGGVNATWEQLKKYAAVAGLKEMGRFDVDMGQSTLEYIIGRHSVNAWGKFTDKVDELSGWLPEMADQVTWCGIWEAAKRKTAAMNPGLKGEALLQKAGELFTDTITRTQVYDSVFSRSANMRAKSGLMSMATAFMAEPTTTANMVEDAVRKFARGDKRMAGKVMSSVAVATVLNAALASVVYAARDDDEDKTYWEKYLASLAGETVDSFNPLTYIPVLSDINNLLLGYSIERTDMSLASDLITALKKITTLYGKYDDEWSDEKKKEWEKKVRDAWMDNAWMAGTVMGLPLKNLARDVEAIINTATNPSNGAEMSADTILKGMRDSARSSLPILSWKADESSSDQLYKAITQKKDVLVKRLKAQYGDEKKYESALLKGLRENDPRIKEAAQYAIDGKTPERVAIIREIVAEGNYTQDQVIKAINQKANSMKGSSGGSSGDTPQKLYDYEEYVPAAANGLGYADEVRKELIRYQADRNQEKDEKLTRAEAEEAAEKTFKSNVESETKDSYAAGELTEAQVRKVLTAAGVVKDEALDKLMLQWNTEFELGSEIEWTDSRYVQFARDIQPAGISVSTYDEYIQAVSKMHNIDEDGDGKDEIKKQEQVIEYIDSMPISDEQKDILFQAEYPTARKSVLRKLPWR